MKEERGLVPWAPPDTNPVATAVLAPLGQLTYHQYLLRMRDRVDYMIREEDEDRAEEIIRHFLPIENNYFLQEPVEEWATGLMEEAGMVKAGLDNNMSNQSQEWPAVVKGPNPWAREGLTVDLGTWLMLVIPRESD